VVIGERTADLRSNDARVRNRRVRARAHHVALNGRSTGHRRLERDAQERDQTSP